MTVCMFPGQGSQSKRMGRDLFGRFVDLTAAASEILGYSIEELCLEDPRNELGNTRFTQPALFVVNALSWRRYREDGGEVPGALLGHSLGEYNALEAAGVMGFEDGLRLVQKRGALMAEAPPGAMAAVIGMSEAGIRETLASNGLEAVDVANLNSPSQTILSGLKDDIQRAAQVLESDSVRYMLLKTSGAFHSRYMTQAREEFETFLAGFTFSAPSIPVISNVHAEPYAADQIAANLASQIDNPVQWMQSIYYLLAQGEQSFVELGPGRVLARLVEEIKKSAPAPQAEPAPAEAPAANDREPEPAQAEAPPAYDREAELAALQRRIDEWNQRYPVGTEVLVEGYQGPLVTRTQAMALFGHRAAIYLEGYNGYFELSDVRPLQ